MILLVLLFMPDHMILLVLLLIFPTLDSHSTLYVSTAWPNDWLRVKRGKISGETSKIIRSASKYKWVRVRGKSGED
jgi:hypothetical protein